MGRLKVWFWVAVAATVIEIALAIITMQRIGKLERLFTAAVANPTDQAIAAVERAGTSADALAWPLVGVTILGLIAIIGWMHSGAVAVRDGALGLLRHSTGWAIGAWFVPFLNLVRVPQIAADLYRAGRSTPRAGLVVGVWWFLWLIDGVASRAIMAQPEPQTPEAVVPALEALSMSYGTTIVSGIATIALLALVTTGLGGAASRPRAPIAPAGVPGPDLWGQPAGPTDLFGAPAPQARFGTPVPAPTAPPVGPPTYSAPPPSVAPPAYVAPAPSAALAPPASPPPVPTAPAGAPAPPRDAPAPSPYPQAQTFYPE